MTEEEKNAYEFYRECNENDLSAFEYFSEPSKKQIKYMETMLNLIEKQQTKIKLLEDDLYSVNDTINKYKERMDKARRILEE